MSRLTETFVSLRNRNYRRYFAAQSVSRVGEWMQRIGQAWLVLELTGSATMLGITAALQRVPYLVVGPWGGLLADRVDKRRLLLVTQSLLSGTALLLAVLTGTGRVELWMVLALALLHGALTAVDHPARQSLVFDMVGPQHLVNAITLDSVVFNAAKTVGPAIAGVMIATIGLAASFYVNAASYLAVVVALLLLRTGELHPAPRAPRAPGQIREGLRYVRAHPALLGTILLMLVSGLFAYEWQVTLPILAVDEFGGDASTLGLMFSAMGVGAVGGGLLVVSQLRPTVRGLLAAGWVFSGTLVLVALAPQLPLTLLALVGLGAASIAFRSIAKSIVQIRAAPEVRSRVVALLTLAVAGTTPIGGPLVGWIAETAGARVALLVGAIATGAALTGAMIVARGQRQDARDEPRARE